MIDILRFVFISPEFLGIIIAVAVYIYKKNLFTIFGSEISSNPTLTGILITAIFSILMGIFKYGKDILLPKENSKILIQWDGYRNLRNRVYFAMFLGIAAFLGCLFSYLLRANINNSLLGFIFIIAIILALISLFTMVLASWKIREIIDSQLEEKF